jgi:cytochrome c oxidase subunit II
MSVFIIITLIVLVFIIIYQIGKASEYATVLRGEEKVKAQTNRTIAFLLLVMFLLSMWGIWKCNELFVGRLLPNVQRNINCYRHCVFSYTGYTILVLFPLPG